MGDDFEDFMAGRKTVDDILADRVAEAGELAKKFPELKGLPFTDMLSRLEELGIHLDFVRASAMHEALNPGKDPGP